MIYLTLFATAFISATLFPMGSEALLLYDLNAGHTAFMLILFASLGNTLGSGLNYYFGLKGEGYLESKGVVNSKSLNRAREFFDRYGGYSLLISWMPIIGDPITFIAGILRYDLKKFILLVSIAKTGRYLFVYLLFLNIF